MRNLKFRVFDRKADKMLDIRDIQGIVGLEGMFSSRILSGKDSKNPHNLTFGHDGWDTMMYTGCVDTQAKEIYEDDIVSFKKGLGVITKVDNEYIVVHRTDVVRDSENSYETYFFVLGWYPLTVVGNIHEDKDIAHVWIKGGQLKGENKPKIRK